MCSEGDYFLCLGQTEKIVSLEVDKCQGAVQWCSHRVYGVEEK